jgi:hypothetical protein
MDNEGTSSYALRSEQQNRADQQREYRERERIAFCNLLAALREVELELTNRCPRREVLRKGEYFFESLLSRAKLTREKAAECLRRLWEEQVNLQQRLGELSGNMGGENILPGGKKLSIVCALD